MYVVRSRSSALSCMIVCKHDIIFSFQLSTKTKRWIVNFVLMTWDEYADSLAIFKIILRPKMSSCVDLVWNVSYIYFQRITYTERSYSSASNDLSAIVAVSAFDLYGCDCRYRHRSFDRRRFLFWASILYDVCAKGRKSGYPPEGERETTRGKERKAITINNAVWWKENRWKNA